MSNKSLIICLAAISMIAAACNPLKIIVNTQKPDGERTLMTSEKVMASHSGVNLTMSMGARIHKQDTLAAVILGIDAASGHGLFDRGNKFFLKLNDGKEIVLTNELEKEYEQHTETHVDNRPVYGTSIGYAYSPWAGTVYLTPYDYRYFVPEVYTTQEGKSYALYMINKEQLKSIIGKGITKIRVEIESGDIDIEENTEGITMMFKDMIELLAETSKQPVRSAEF